MPPTQILRHRDLAARLGVDVTRLRIEVEQEGAFVSIQVTIDGADLSPAQESVARAYVMESTYGLALLDRAGRA